MNPAVGIDLGTTNTVVAVQTDGTGPRLLPVPQPIEYRSALESVDHVKSAVLLESDRNAVVGAFAAHRLDSIRSIKSHMGTRWRQRHPYSSVTMSPAYVAGHILRATYNELQRQFPAWDRSAIITVPASFNTDQRQDTLQAAAYSGFQHVRLLDEPVAAFYYYFDQNRDDVSTKAQHTYLVFDFGGGTLDVSIVRISQDSQGFLIDPIGRSRYNNLGGDDIDVDIAAFFLGCWEHTSSVPLSDAPKQMRRALHKLFIDKARAFKEETEERLRFGDPIGDFFIEEQLTEGHDTLKVSIHRQIDIGLYDEMAGRYFSNQTELNIFKPIAQCVDIAVTIDPTFRLGTLDLVLYTGGASRMRGVQAGLSAHFAPVQCLSISHEDACNTVALGAAACRYDEMHRAQGIRMTSRLLESILTRSSDGRRYIPLVPITCEPTSEFQRIPELFRTQRDAIRLAIPLFRGASATDHQLAALRDLRLPLPCVLPADTPYELQYRMTANKTIELKAVFSLPSGSIEVAGALNLDIGQAEAGRATALCEVNVVKG